MLDQAAHQILPQIVVCEADYDRLNDMATGLSDRLPEVAGQLLDELERATVVRADAFPSTAVRIGSRVTYRWDEGATREIVLVLPGEADISQGRVSVLTPIGTALLGLSQGQSIPSRARNGEGHLLTVLAVEPPAARAG